MYLDIKKAFDTVNLEILTDKLYSIGIQGDILRIIKSYLANRKQQVEINGHISELKEVRLGVPHGSILGPLLFIIYINDLSNIDDDIKFYQFADDTAVVIEGDSYEHFQSKINTLVPKLAHWFSSNRSSLNPAKTYYQIYSLFSNHQDVNVILSNVKLRENFLLDI